MQIPDGLQQVKLNLIENGLTIAEATTVIEHAHQTTQDVIETIKDGVAAVPNPALHGVVYTIVMQIVAANAASIVADLQQRAQVHEPPAGTA